MEKTYLINNEEGFYSYVIKAGNQEEAMDKFYEAHFFNDDFWAEDCPRLHLEYQFDKHGEFFSDYTGELRKDIAEMKDPTQYIAKHIEKGLHSLFGDYPEMERHDLVNHYMDFYY